MSNVDRKTNRTNGKNTVLVIDDSKSMCNALKTFLEKDYNIEVRHTRQSALKHLSSKGKYYAAIVDINLKDSESSSPTPETGYSLLKELTEQYPELPLIAMSGFHGTDTRKVIESGAWDYTSSENLSSLNGMIMNMVNKGRPITIGIVGASGNIGGDLCKKVIREFNIRRLILFGRNKEKLVSHKEKLRNYIPAYPYIIEIGSSIKGYSDLEFIVFATKGIDPSPKEGIDKMQETIALSNIRQPKDDFDIELLSKERNNILYLIKELQSLIKGGYDNPILMLENPLEFKCYIYELFTHIPVLGLSGDTIRLIKNLIEKTQNICGIGLTPEGLENVYVFGTHKAKQMVIPYSIIKYMGENLFNGSIIKSCPTLLSHKPTITRNVRSEGQNYVDINEGETEEGAVNLTTIQIIKDVNSGNPITYPILINREYSGEIIKTYGLVEVIRKFKNGRLSYEIGNITLPEELGLTENEKRSIKDVYEAQIGDIARLRKSEAFAYLQKNLTP